MQRVSTAVLLLLAVAVFSAAGYVIVHNDDLPTSSPSIGAVAETDTPSASPTVSSPPSSSPSSSPSSAGTQLVAFLGDSWTSGVQASKAANRFTTRLAESLGVRERNFGVKGGGYAAGSSYAEQVDRIVAARPSAVVVSGGRVDVVDIRLGTTSRGKVDDAVTSLFATLHRRLPKAKLIAIRPMWGDSAAPSQLDDLATSVRSAVTQADGTYLDVDDPIEGHPGWMASASGPNDKGYAAIADALAPKLRPLLSA